MTQTIAHLSDLHIGFTAEHFQRTVALYQELTRLSVDHIIITGDVTENGLEVEYQKFQDLFARELEAKRLTVVPGNHDRLGDDIARHFMEDKRFLLTRHPGFQILNLDSTCSYNRYHRAMEQGDLTLEQIEEISRTMESLPKDELCIITLHHHVIDQAEEYFAEKVSAWFGFSVTNKLELGPKLIEQVHGRCDLILHGHRHVPLETHLSHPERDLHIYNAGSSTESQKFRIFHVENGKLIGEPEWIDLSNSAIVT